MYYICILIVNLDAAYLEFLTTNFPRYNERIVPVPVSFNYNIHVKDEATKEQTIIQGIIIEKEGRGEREKSKKQKEWCKAAKGLRAEEKIFDKLREQFSDQPCLLLNGFKEQFMFKLIKEKNQKKERMKLINEQVSLFLDTVEKSFFLENDSQKEPEKTLLDLLWRDNQKNKFRETVKSCLEGSYSEKPLEKGEMHKLLVRKMLELTNPTSEYDVLLFQKVREEMSETVFI